MMQNAETVDYKNLSSSYYLFFKTYFISLHVWTDVCAPHAYSVLKLELEAVLNWHVGGGNWISFWSPWEPTFTRTHQHTDTQIHIIKEKIKFLLF